ncbi:Extracellular ribonuclease LE [Glycine soja]|nr:Extracellular ribonuclease LE [Glycine soja]
MLEYSPFFLVPKFILREKEREIEGKKASKIMKPNFSFLSKLLILQYLSVLCISQEFDFFYFVQQWPGAYCDTKQSCCYPKTGKPAIYHILVLEVNCLASTLKVLNLTVILPNTLSFSFHLWV